MTDPFRNYLDHGAVFAAMMRGAEHGLVARYLPLPQPALDLGCGDGFFASLLPGSPFCAGIDPDARALAEAQATGAYRSLAAATALDLPFRTASIATVMANSVLEHIPNLDGAIAEIARVLTPGGRLLVTGPSHRFGDLLFGSQWLTGYGRWFNGHSRHFHTDDSATWKSRLARHGLTLAAWQYYFPPAAMRAFDLAHYLSLPRLASRKLTGRWVLSPRISANALYERWFRRHADPSPVPDGGGLFLEARKP